MPVLFCVLVCVIFVKIDDDDNGTTFCEKWKNDKDFLRQNAIGANSVSAPPVVVG